MFMNTFFNNPESFTNENPITNVTKSTIYINGIFCFTYFMFI